MDPVVVSEAARYFPFFDETIFVQFSICAAGLCPVQVIPKSLDVKIIPLSYALEAFTVAARFCPSLDDATDVHSGANLIVLLLMLITV